MAVGRAERRDAREARVRTAFPGHLVDPALDMLEILELAWHDCYQEISPAEDVIDDVLLLSGGDLASLIQASRLAVVDWRDLRVSADARRAQQ